MITYRLVVALEGSKAEDARPTNVCIDVVLRSDDKYALDKVGRKVALWLDFESQLPGAWVDSGTERAEITLVG